MSEKIFTHALPKAVKETHEMSLETDTECQFYKFYREFIISG